LFSIWPLLFFGHRNCDFVEQFKFIGDSNEKAKSWMEKDVESVDGWDHCDRSGADWNICRPGRAAVLLANYCVSQ
jgi:hypothetical protein